MKTAELSGAALDWAVAKCADLPYPHVYDEQGGIVEVSPSTNWAQGGPIIEREKIGFAFNGGQWVGFYMSDEIDEYDWDFRLSVYGSTPLIAAMRCYVASKLGDEVELPEELEVTA
jgi:hypothetical protein